jgi:hypothetical protein
MDDIIVFGFDYDDYIVINEGKKTNNLKQKKKERFRKMKIITKETFFDKLKKIFKFNNC